MSKKEKTGGKSHKGLLFFLLVLVIISGVLISLYLVRSEEVSVEGNRYVPGDVIISRVYRDDDHKTLLHVLVNAFFRRITIPGFDSVKVVPVELKASRIDVKESEAFSCCVARDKWAVLTEKGIILSVADKPDESLIRLKGIRLLTEELLTTAESDDQEMLEALLQYVSYIKQYDLPFSELLLENDRITGIMGPVRIILGQGDFAKEKIAEIKAQEGALRGLKGTLHMEDYANGEAANRYYFEVD